MLYTIIKTNGTTTTIEARNTSEAHALFFGEKIKAYPATVINDYIQPYNVVRGALQVATISAKKTADRTGGNNTQIRIRNELVSINHRAGAVGAEELGINYIYDLINTLSADSQNYYSTAITAIIESISKDCDIITQYHNAFLAINKSISELKTASQRELSTEYITDGSGNIVAINNYIAKIINNNERYTPTDGGTLDSATAERLSNALTESFKLLTPRQRDIIKYIGRDYSQRQTAERLNIKSVSTVNEHLVKVRKIILEYFTEYAPEFLYLINSIGVNEAVDKRSNNRHINEYYKHYKAKK